MNQTTYRRSAQHTVGCCSSLARCAPFRSLDQVTVPRSSAAAATDHNGRAPHRRSNLPAWKSTAQ